MSVMRNITIKYKLISIIMATCLVVLVLAGTVQLLFEWREYWEETIHSISCYAQMIGDNCMAALVFEDAKDTTETLKSLQAESSVVFACVYTKEGKVLARYQRPDLTGEISPPIFEKEGYRLENNYFKLFKQIKDNNEVIGTVYIQFDLSNIKTMLWLKADTIALIVLACTLVAYLVSSRLQRVISGPIVDLAEVTKVVSEEKNYSIRAVKQNNDEVGLLIDAFNAMLEQIQQSDSNLRDARDKLETRVKERTMELTIANEQLTREIKERKRAEKELERKQRNLEAIFDAAPVSMLLVDENTVVKRTNYVATKLIGRNDSEIISFQPGNGMGCIHVSDDIKGCGHGPFCASCKIRNTIENVLRSGQAVHGVEVQPTISVKGKELYPWFKVSVEPVTVDNSKHVIVAIDDITERKKAEEALEESEQRFKQVAECAGEWIWEVNTEGLYTYTSPVVEKILGYKPQEIVGKKYFYDFFAPDVKNELKKAAFEVFSRKQSIASFVNPNVHKNGSIVFIQTSGMPVFDNTGNLIGYRGLDTDITERKQAEVALRESENKIRSIVENSSDQIFMLDRDCKFLSINKAAADLSGKAPQEMIGKSLFEVFPEDIAEQFSKNIKNVFDAGKNMSISEQMVVQGREFYIDTSLNPIKDDEGVVKAVTGIVRDITEHRRAEQSLRESEKKYRTLIENLPQKVFLKDRDSNYISCNENYADDVGVNPDQIKGKTDYEFFPGELAEKYRRDDKRIMETGATETFEEKYVNAGQEMIVQTVKTPVEDEQGNIIGVLGIFWDITDLKRAQEELHQTNEKLLEASRKAGMAEVATDVLHNVGNVLNSINVSTSVITEKIKDSEVANLEKVVNILNEHTSDLGMFLTENPRGKKIPLYLMEVSKVLINEQAETLGILRKLSDNVQHIKDVITAQQSYAKVSGLEVTASISGLVEDAIQINSAGLQRHGTRLVREFEQLGEVKINKQKVLQILVNLISNAKYALSDSKKEEKIVTVRIYKRREDRFRIEVADNGIGISRENLTKIFSHGFTTKEHGHGFGLHSSALASKEIGGSLTVRSDGPEKGATFTLELPFKPVKSIK
jgi:PAS domain S-box-containing protein